MNSALATRSLWGGPLSGSKLVRFIYQDEAGVSPHEPVTVVASVVIHGDTQWKPANEMLAHVRDTQVPEEFREGFFFHCKDIYNDPKKRFRDKWPLDARIEIIRNVLKIIGELECGVSIGFSRRHPSNENWNPQVEVKMRHLMAFACRVAGAHAYMLEKAPGEIATLVAENTPEMNKWLSDIVDELQKESGIKEMFPTI